MSRTGSTLAGAIRTFGALPFASMIRTFQGPGLRKHPGVSLDDLFMTERFAPQTLVNQACSILPFFEGIGEPINPQGVRRLDLASSVLQDGVVDSKRKGKKIVIQGRKDCQTI